MAICVYGAKLELFQCVWGEGSDYLIILKKLQLLQSFQAFIGVEIDCIEMLQN
jgi:hypothetical protein